NTKKKGSHANRCLDQKAKAGDPGCLLIREMVLSHDEGRRSPCDVLESYPIRLKPSRDRT
ncbi:MAG: hypothetical protein AAGK24_01990, partial [Planctomycetota bacterium]